MQSSGKPLKKIFRTKIQNLIQKPKSSFRPCHLVTKTFYQVLLKLDAQNKKIYSFITYYNECLEKMSANNKVSTSIELSKTELEATMNIILD